MKITEVKERTDLLIEQLLKVWESSVKATHFFLSDKEIEDIKKYVPQALKEIPTLIVSETESGNLSAFMGIDNNKLEMLFIKPEECGKGLGRKLLQYGIENYNVCELAVNEQNPLAKGFYEHIGFEIYNQSVDVSRLRGGFHFMVSVGVLISH